MFEKLFKYSLDEFGKGVLRLAGPYGLELVLTAIVAAVAAGVLFYWFFGRHLKPGRRYYIGRGSTCEVRILDLKHEVNELLAQAGKPPRYPSAEIEGIPPG